VNDTSKYLNLKPVEGRNRRWKCCSKII